MLRFRTQWLLAQARVTCAGIRETDIIEDFLARYRREYDFYQEAARICTRQCEVSLRQAAIRAMVTFRAKDIDSLRLKLRERNADNVD